MNAGLASRVLTLVAGPAAAALVATLLHAFAAEEALSLEARGAAAVMAWMAVWWLTEAIPLAATALLPLVLLPVFCGVPLSSAASEYAGRVIFLFLGGFMLALAMERCNLHRRIALITLLLVGQSPARLVGGFMLVTAVLSMWISNTATAVMLVPIGISVVRRALEQRDAATSNFGTCVMLGIAYAASIGGVATPIGTPPNALLLQYLNDSLGVRISFLQWMLVGLPVVLVFLPITWIVLTKFLYPVGRTPIASGRAVVQEELAEMGRLSRGEICVMCVFGCAVAAWLVRGILVSVSIEPGATSAFAEVVRFARTRIDDSSIAIVAALLLFVIPTSLRRGEFLLDWKTAERLPWGVLLLFGGGLSLANAAESTGLSTAIGSLTSELGGIPILVVVLALVTLIVFFGELASNTAMAAIVFPIIGGVAVGGLGVDPLLLLFPAAIGASFGFMLPVATPPNAIVYGSGAVTTRQMAKAGFALDVLGIILVTGMVYSLVLWLLLPMLRAE